MHGDLEPHGSQPISDIAPPLPRPHLLRQQWRDVSFLHWAVSPESIAPHLPPGTRPDLHEGRAYVGMIPFRMVDTGAARGPAVPWLGTFPETNVRLYSVDDAGRRGVVFCSLDAARAVPVVVGRLGFGLPYVWTRMDHRVDHHGTWAVHTYSARRRGLHRTVSSRLAVRVDAERIGGPLESFLTARWGFHVAHLGRTWFLPNHHEPWPLRSATVHEMQDDFLAAAGFPEAEGREPDHVAHAAAVTTRFGRPEPVSG